MNELLELIRILSLYVKKNGEVELTNLSLLDILEKTRRSIDFKIKQKEMDDNEHYWDILN